MATTDVPDWLRNSACPRLRFPGDLEAEEVDVLLRTFLLAAPPRRREALGCGATGRRNGGTMGILRAGLLLLPLLLLPPPPPAPAAAPLAPPVLGALLLLRTRRRRVERGRFWMPRSKSDVGCMESDGSKQRARERGKQVL